MENKYRNILKRFILYKYPYISLFILSFSFYSYMLNKYSTHETSLMSYFWIKIEAMVLEECRGYSYLLFTANLAILNR
jgi:hypothetical protein